MGKQHTKLKSGKVKTVSVNRTQFHLSEEAHAEYEYLHDEWEVNICKKHPHDPLIGGKILISYKLNINEFNIP